MSDRALFPVSGPGASSTQPRSKGLRLADLEDDVDFESMRENEGEAAQYGIYYDDTKYDYMQHLRDIGEDSGEAHLVDAAPVKVKGKGKAKVMKLEDVLRETSLECETECAEGSALDDRISTFSRSTRPRTYQNQQDVPDEIAGFQPDMDPRLREALEALDDDAFIDENYEEDTFCTLTGDGQNEELDLDEFEASHGDDGWESDATERPSLQEKEVSFGLVDNSTLPETIADSNLPFTEEAAKASAEDGDWLRDFAKFKQDAAKKPAPKPAESIGVPSAINGPASTLFTLNGTPLRQKRRKGALTNPSTYSMTSSSLARTEGQQLLDARFERVEAMYALDEVDELDDEDCGISLVSGTSRQSKMSTLSTSFADPDVRTDLDGVMDGFLDSWDKGHPGGGKRKGAKGKRGKNGNEVLGMRILDEIRGELGPAKVHRPQKF